MNYSYQRILIIVLCSWILCSFPCHGQTLRFEKLTLRDGLPASECYKIMSDQHGYIWMFSEYGIVKHNGTKFYPVCTNLDAKDQNAYSVVETDGGEIYFSNSYNKIFKIRNDSAFSIKTIEDFTVNFILPDEVIFQIAVDTNQDIYFSNYNASYRYIASTDRVEKISVSENLPDLSLCYKKISNHYFPIRNQDYLNGKYYDIYIQDKQNTFIGSLLPDVYYETRKLQKINDFYVVATGWNIYRLNSDKTVVGRQLDGVLNYLVLDDKIWVLTGNGIKVLNFDLELIAEYLTGKIISDACVDDYGGIWISTIGNGVYYCRDQNLLSYENTALKNEEILFLKPDSGTLYFSNPSGACYMLKNNSPQLIHQLHGNFKCVDISSYRGGYLISTKNGLFYKSEKGAFREFHGMRGLTLYSNGTRVINDDEFISFGGTNLMHFSHDTLAHYCRFPDKYYCMTPYKSDDYLIGTKTGIYLYTQATQSLQIFSDFFSHKTITKLITDAQQNLWISTKGDGVYLITPDNRIIHYSDIQSLTINDIDFFGTDGIILSTNQGIYLNQAKMKNNASDWICIFYEESRCVEIAQNVIWITSKSGLYSKTLESLSPNKSFPIYIHSVYSNSQPLNTDFTKLAYNKNDLRFNFNFLNYKLPVQKFYYSLSGPTQSSGVIAGNILQIQNLSPGSYTLNVFPFTGSTYKEDLFISKTFQITPAYWQTYWFRTLVIFAIVLISGSLVRYYYRTKRKRERAVVETNSRIAEYKLTALQAQINPHFISNLLAAVQLLIEAGNTDKANQYIAKFGLLIRYVLNYSDKSIARLSDELRIIDLYVELEQLRFAHRFKFTKKIDEDIDPAETYIPPLITQPFLENAIWHGLSSAELIREPEIILHVKKENDRVILSISDNGLGRNSTIQKKKNLSHSTKQESKGIAIIQGRIDNINQLYHTQKAELKITDLYDDSQLPVGTRVDLKLPFSLFIKLEQHHESNSD